MERFLFEAFLKAHIQNLTDRYHGPAQDEVLAAPGKGMLEWDEGQAA